MKILKKQVLRGPNVWSNYRKNLIQVRLDLEEMEDRPTDKIPGFKERLEALLPGMIDHECSEGGRGGFFERLRRGTWLGHVIEHVALEIQTLAGMEVGYGRTRGTGERGVYNMVFAYSVEEAGLFAADAAFNLVQALATNQPYELEPDLAKLRELKSRYGLGPSTKSLCDEADRRKIPWTRLGNSTIRFGYGKNQATVQATITSKTSLLGVEAAGDKYETKKKLEKAYIPVAEGKACNNTDDLMEIISDLGYPLVIKPLDANQGKGATIDIRDDQQALEAFAHAQQYSRYVLVERYITGHDFRMLVINGKFVAAARREPAHVHGNGTCNIEQLVEYVNSDPKRGNGHDKALTKITLDHDSLGLLKRKGYTPQSIPTRDEVVYLKSTANLSTGGTAIDVTDEVHPENIFLAERVAGVMGLDICGIDIMAPTLQSPLRQNAGVVIEVNAAPGFRMHLEPSEGKPRNVASAVMDMLFPPGRPSRIPIIGITGTNGKTTTTRLMAHLARNRGFRTGFTTTDGIYINDFIINEGDNTGPLSAGFILGDPTVEFAVLETARGGLLRSGLSYDQCDVGIITNIREDHLGLNDINTLDDLANVKAVVARSVKRTGYAVLNADDVNCVRIASELDCNVAFFSMDPDAEVIREHIERGKPVAIFQDGYLTIIRDGETTRIEKAARIPITYGGTADFMIANALAAALAGYLWGFSAEEIRQSFSSFEPGFEQTPGRLNYFDFKDFKVLVDYAHNPHGYLAVAQYLESVKANRKIGIISGIGDRRDQDIAECARIACDMFDHIIIRQEHDLRGRSESNINGLLIQGIMASCRKVSYEMISEETDAIRRALRIAQAGDLVVALSDQYKSVVEVIRDELDRSNAPRIIRPDDIDPHVQEIQSEKNHYHGKSA